MERKVPKGEVPAVVLINPNFSHNVGAALRGCSCFDAKQLWWTGKRVQIDLNSGERLKREERMKGYKNVVWTNHDRPLDQFPAGVVPVVVELLATSEPLTTFVHPENAVYIFGPEDGDVPVSIRTLAHRFVFIPSRHCLNLSAAVNVVLADRMMKRQLAGLEPIVPVGEMLWEDRDQARPPRGFFSPELDKFGLDGR
jgi:tRNA(Leu) C34 or U34 (ribose-2'-O)-methylase TrmL